MCRARWRREICAQIKQPRLQIQKHLGQTGIPISTDGDSHTERRIGLVRGAVGLHTRIILGNTRPAKEARRSIVTRLCIEAEHVTQRTKVPV